MASFFQFSVLIQSYNSPARTPQFRVLRVGATRANRRAATSCRPRCRGWSRVCRSCPPRSNPRERGHASKAGVLVLLLLRFLAPLLCRVEDTIRRVARALPNSVQHRLLRFAAFRQASLAKTIVSSICSLESYSKPQAASCRSFHESRFAMQPIPDRPSVLFAKATHVNSVLQTTSIPVCAGSLPLLVCCAVAFRPVCW